MSDAQPSRLSNISTMWTTVRDAHRQHGDDAAYEAQLTLFERYQGAVYRYLLGALGDVDAAEDVFQEFALRLVSGRFSKANQDKGRFRDYLRTTLINMVTDHHRKKARTSKRELVDQEIADAVAVEADRRDLFDGSWRDELLHLAWEALRAHQESHGNLHYSALQLRVGQPDLRSAALAELLSRQVGKQINAAAYRKMVERARDTFAQLLVNEVAQSIQSTDRDDINLELQSLNLFTYCKRS